MSENHSPSSVFNTTLHTKQHHLTPNAHCSLKISNTDDYQSCAQYFNMAMASNNMASPVKLESDDVFHVATDSEGDTELEDISLEELQELDCKFTMNADRAKFPLGCKVWYNVRTSRVSVSTNSLRANSASVVGVYMHYENWQKVYKLKSDAATQCETFLYEDCLVYGMNCPVTVINTSTNDIHIQDGVIVCPKLNQVGDGEQKVSSYDVQILQGSDITIEFGVAADRIKYRFEKPANNTCANSKIKEVGEESSVVMEIEVSEREEEEDPNRKELPTCRSISKKSNDDTESALPSVQQPDASTAQSAENNSSESEKASVTNICAEAERKIKGGEESSAVNEVKANEKSKKEPKGLPKCPSIPKKSNDDEATVLKPGAKQLEASASEIPTIQSAETTSGEISAVAKAEAGNINPDKYTNLAKTEKVHYNRRRTIMNKPLTSKRRNSPPQKRSAESTTIQRPSKMIKTDGDGRSMLCSDLKCTLVIPSWMPQEKDVIRQKRIRSNLYGHLIGVKGNKTKWISSAAGCKIHISDEKPMKIELSSNASENIELAICMIEDSLKKFLSDKDSEKRLYYELATSAFGSYKPRLERTPHGLLMKRYTVTGKKSWWGIFELPRNITGEYNHGKHMLYKKKSDNCRIDFFSNTKHTSPYVLVSGDTLADTKVAASMVAVAEWMRLR